MHNRKRCMYDFHSAQLIGVLFKTNDSNEFQLVKNFLHYLRELDNKVIALSYIDSKKIPDYYLLVKGFNFFSRKSINFFYLPQNPIVNDFIEQPLDMLIDLTIDESFPIKYISVLSKAKFKIGMRQKRMEKYYDLMIDIEKDKSIANLIEGIKYYIPLFAGKIH
ncbi:MAG: hypothetical protein N2662_05850 [Bacteroidales bacterium]|nr:hypothetical protein [Bacteroidales bacterium]